MKQRFNDLLVNLKPTIADYKYYVDFNKVYNNVNKYKVELNILNSLIGSKNIEKDFLYIINEYPKTLKVIPLLIAVRRYEVSIFDDKNLVFDFKNQTIEPNLYIKFMNETGLFELLSQNKIKSLIDYVTGVEVGLDSNARKNRTGIAMENIVEGFIKKTKYESYYKEINKSEIKSLFSIDLDEYIKSTETMKIAGKRFDFVIKTKSHIYLIETNFYSGGGSKLNETARSFKSLANDLSVVQGVSFIWITDGIGWRSAKNNLEETYDSMEHLYTLYDLENGVLNKVIK